MIVKINNEVCPVKDGTKLSDIAAMRGACVPGVAIALNGRVIRRETWSVTEINDADDIIIIHAAYGG